MKAARRRAGKTVRVGPTGKRPRARSPRKVRKAPRQNPQIPPNGNPMSNQVERAIAIAQTKLGCPYVWATAGPDTFDCSGFTWWIACQVLGPQDYELRSSHHQF